MASTTAPSTPNHPRTLQRSFTLPPKLSESSRSRVPTKTPGHDAIETLFAHNAGRIVSFSSSPTNPVKPRAVSVGGAEADEEPVGTLPWASQREKTMAAGPLSIYQVPGSVAFLSSGKILHPILPKSQCWCVDGETKFVLRIRANNYYRIELPNTCDEDKKVAEDLKRTFAKVLQYETTACPFKRGFHVDLPEQTVTPKRPWKPKHRPASEASITRSMSTGGEESANTSDHESSLISTDDEQTDNIHNPAGAPSMSQGESEQVPQMDSVKSLPKPVPVEEIVSAFEELKTPTAAVTPESVPMEKVLASEPVASSDEQPEIVQTQSDRQPPPKEPERVLEQDNEAPLPLSDTRIPMVVSQSEEAMPVMQSDEMPTAIDDELPSQSGVPADAPGFKWVDDFEDESPTPVKPKVLAGNRSVTAPPNLKMMPSASSKNFIRSEGPIASDPDNASLAESMDSFHSFHSPISPLPPSPPVSTSPYSPQNLEDFGIEVPRTRQHKHSVSTLTITAESSSKEKADLSTLTWPEDSPITPTSPEQGYSFERLPRSRSRSDASNVDSRSVSPSTSIRRRFNNRRSHSPLPHSANLYTPGNSRFNGHHITAAVLQKTCSMLLGPPVQLVALMLNIAARIGNGAIIGESSIYVESGRHIPCSWDSDEDADSLSDEAWVDDYGISLSGESPRRRRARQTSETGGSWELD